MWRPHSRARLSRESDLYTSAARFLESIRLSCEPFDQSAVRYYKWLQGIDLEEGLWVLELRGSRSALEAHKKLTVYGKSEEDYHNLKSVDRNIVVSLFDQSRGKEILYEAAIRDTGRLSGAGVEFKSRLYASHDGSPRPELKGPAVPPPSVIGSASSWATVALIEELIGESFEMPPTERWLPASDDAGHVRIPAELRKWFAHPAKPLLQKPVPRSVFERRDSVPDAGPQSLESPSKLLRKKIVRAKRLNGESFTPGTKRQSPVEER